MINKIIDENMKFLVIKKLIIDQILNIKLIRK